MVPDVLDLGVNIIALVSDVLNLSGDVGVLVLDVRDLGVDIGGSCRKSVLQIERWRGREREMFHHGGRLGGD